MIKDFLEELESESDASPSERGALQSFLQRHGFTSIYSARQVNCRVVRVERVYPIHVAAQLGDLTMVRMLLEEGADARQVCLDGRTAVDFARSADVNGSHREVMEVLDTGIISISF
ncbi:Receptor-likey region [Durusdinium trenchii]|uniref:Transmembrane domain-and RING domain-containing protein 6 n=1 Tax=Durusdinium trenchii TaxID=1381693 RepID=A0ABP0MGU1_9DINO